MPRGRCKVGQWINKLFKLVVISRQHCSRVSFYLLPLSPIPTLSLKRSLTHNTMSGLTPVFGGGGFNPGRSFGELDEIKKVFALLKAGGCTHIDTAALYGESERLLGEAKAGDEFTLDTKHKGGFGGKGYATKEKVIEEAGNSKKMLGHDVDILYIHAPDGDTKIEETLAGVNEVYKKGFFKRFGLSNYKAEDVERVYEHCKEKGYPLPKVYQGMAGRGEVIANGMAY